MKFDIIIVGGGVVGLTAALSLAKNASLKIGVIESADLSTQLLKYDARVSAISLASKSIFQNLNVWEAISAENLSPYTEMVVWDSETKGKIQFNSLEVNKSALGYIIEDKKIHASLLAKMADYSNIHVLAPFRLTALQIESDQILLTGSEQQILSTQLLIGADGANSWVRDAVGIELKTVAYEQTAIVTTVTTEHSHKKTAWQRFLPTGPLAFLPLADEKNCSIVWSADLEFAKKLLALPENEFAKCLSESLEKKLGNIQSLGKRLHFPLHRRQAKNYVKPRIALIGDAAHTIHPLAGQGVNLGIADASCLADVVLTAIDKQRDFYSLNTLRVYERERKSENALMMMSIDNLKKLFASEKKSMQLLRGLGLNVMDKIGLAKHFFVNYASG